MFDVLRAALAVSNSHKPHHQRFLEVCEAIRDAYTDGEDVHLFQGVLRMANCRFPDNHQEAIDVIIECAEEMAIKGTKLVIETVQHLIGEQTATDTLLFCYRAPGLLRGISEENPGLSQQILLRNQAIFLGALLVVECEIPENQDNLWYTISDCAKSFGLKDNDYVNQVLQHVAAEKERFVHA